MNSTDKSLAAFIEAEIENLKAGPKILESVAPGGMKLLETCNGLLIELLHEFCRSPAFLGPYDTIANWKERHGVGNDVAALLLTGTLLPGSKDDTVAAKSQATRAWAAHVRSMLLLRVVRDYWYAASDLLRNRVTHALGSFRTQRETIGQIMLLADAPEIAIELLPVRAPASGREFYRKYHRRVLEKTKPLALTGFSDAASELQMHSRIAGISAGMRNGGRQPPAPGTVIIRSLSAQDLEDPVLYRLCFSYLLEFFCRVLGKAELVLPDVEFSEAFRHAVAGFVGEVKKQWAALEPEAKRRGWKKGIGGR